MDETKALCATTNQADHTIITSPEDESDTIISVIESEFTDQKNFVSDSLKIIHKENMIVVGGIFVDTDPVNPFDDMDGLGHIYHYGRRANSKEEKNSFLSAIGYTNNEDRDIDNEYVKKELSTLIINALNTDVDLEKRYRIYKTIFDAQIDLSTTINKQDYVHTLIEDAIYDSNLSDLVQDFCEYAFGCRRGSLNDKTEEILEPLFKILKNRDIQIKAWEKCTENGTVGNIYVRKLDIYEHSGILYSLYNEGTQCYFDTSSVGAVWVPSETIIEEARYQAFHEITGIEFKTVYSQDGKTNVVLYKKPDEDFHGDDLKASTFNEMIKRLWNTRAINKNVFNDKVQKHITKAARSVLEIYNEYLNGGCYSISVQELDPATGDILNDSSVSGFYGLRAAEEELLSCMM